MNVYNTSDSERHWRKFELYESFVVEIMLRAPVTLYSLKYLLSINKLSIYTCKIFWCIFIFSVPQKRRIIVTAAVKPGGRFDGRISLLSAVRG